VRNRLHIVRIRQASAAMVTHGAARAASDRRLPKIESPREALFWCHNHPAGRNTGGAHRMRGGGSLFGDTSGPDSTARMNTCARSATGRVFRHRHVVASAT
jgi:hypothetical protein